MTPLLHGANRIDRMLNNRDGSTIIRVTPLRIIPLPQHSNSSCSGDVERNGVSEFPHGDRNAPMRERNHG